MLKSKCNDYCHTRQVQKIHLRNTFATQCTLRAKICDFKQRGKPSVSACLFGMLAFAQSTRGQQDPAAGKSTTSTTQGGSAPEKDASAAAEQDLEKAVQNPVASLISVPVQNNTNLLNIALAH
jgi:hypothetical protein